MNLNKAFILGNLTKDPELRQKPQGQSVCTLSVATNTFFLDRNGNKQRKTEFHSVVLWGKQAEIASQFLKKGSLILVEGRLQTRVWQDRNGNQRKVTEIIAEKMQLGPKKVENILAPEEDEEKIIEEIESDVLPQIDLDDSETKVDDIPF
jgi:single-strand DNA-binding protein